MTNENESHFLRDPASYFAGSYGAFLSFGGPSVYFHRECLKARNDEFLSKRHIEMLYATLASWGMHRMGSPTRTKLVDWRSFRRTLLEQRGEWERLRDARMIDMSVTEYNAVLSGLANAYSVLQLSESGQSVVVNAKALYHLLPELVPPIDRQHSIRFFLQPSNRWLLANGRLRTICLPAEAELQFQLFRKVCVSVKRMADQLGGLIEAERESHGVTAPKALDNAIVNYVKLVRAELVGLRSVIA